MTRMRTPATKTENRRCPDNPKKSGKPHGLFRALDLLIALIADPLGSTNFNRTNISSIAQNCRRCRCKRPGRYRKMRSPADAELLAREVTGIAGHLTGITLRLRLQAGVRIGGGRGLPARGHCRGARRGRPRTDSRSASCP